MDIKKEEKTMESLKNIKKFRALRFNSTHGDISNLVAPPYDVFDYGDSTDVCLRENPSNIVHIQKPLGEGLEKYKNAAEILKDFISKKILIREKRGAFYILREEGKTHTRTGLTAAVKIDPEYKRIREHERTKAKPLHDRINLTFATNTLIGSVFTVAPDRDGVFKRTIEKDYEDGELLYDFISAEGVRTRLYKTEKDIYSELLNDSVLYIADGHHRYKTAIKYSQAMKEKSGPVPESFNYLMAHIVPCGALTIYPTHRLIADISKEESRNIVKKIKEQFKTVQIPQPQIPSSRHVGVYMDNSFFTVKSTMPEKPDTAFLEEEILKPFFPKKYKIHHLSGGKSVLEQVKDKTDRGLFSLSFIMAPLSFDEVRKAADKREMLPPKSTFFYPKIPSGTLMYEFQES